MKHKVHIKNMRKCALATAISLLMISGSQATAQEATQGSEEDEVILVLGVRGSILNSLNQKREADGFVDAISAENLGKFPDLNLSESLQRISGVTLQRNDFGDGQSINLRGLGPAFTRVELNGMTGTNNDAQNGGFNFEILASELFSNITVHKSLSAKNVEGGLAGLVELSTPHAFDRDGFNFTVSAQGQYGEIADDISPRTAILMSQNWNDVFGITASLAYSDTKYQTNSNGGISARSLFAPATDDLRASATQTQLDALLPQTINYEVNIDERKTIGTTFGMQYRPSDKLEITLDTIYASIDAGRFFTRSDAPPESQISAISNETIVDGVIQSATLTNVQNRIAPNDNDTDEEFYQISAKVEYQPNDDWTITPYIGFSSREVDTNSSLLSFARGDLATGSLERYDVTYNVTEPFIEFSSPGTDFSPNSAAEEFMLNVFIFRPSTDQDEEFSSKIDFTKHFYDEGLSHIDFGARYSERDISRSAYELLLVSATDDRTTLPSLADALVINDFEISGAPSSFPSQLISANPQQIVDLYLPNGFDFASIASPQVGDVSNEFISGESIDGTLLINRRNRAAQNTFSGKEETFALYAEATMEFENLLLKGGLRYISTDQESMGYQVANDISAALSVTNSYSEYLPSLIGRYNVTDDIIVRAGYSKTLTRPTLFDLRVAESFGGIDESGGTGSRGNPALQPFTSDNIDFGVEWYFAEESLLAINLFKKSIDGLVVDTVEVEDREFLSQVSGGVVTGPITFTLPENGSEASVEGIEFVAQSRFDFLPGALSNLGGIFNYTYADSDSAFEEGGDATAGTGLTGLSKNSLNAIVYYDDGIFDARLSYAYRNRFVETLAGSFGVPVFQEGRGQLDFSLNYAVTEKFTLQFQGLNLTEERLETQSLGNLPHDTAQLDRRWFFGGRYSL